VNLGQEHKPLRTLVLDELREQIISGELEQGSRIVEDQVARELGVSRNPVREALRVLEAEGLVEMNARRGAAVAAVSDSDVEHVFEMREAFESFAARLAARRVTPAARQILAAELAEATAAVRGGNPAALTHHNTRFHATVYQLGDNKYLLHVMEVIGGRIEWIFRQNAVSRGPGSLEEHAAIVQAISDGDEDLAASLAAQHVQAAHAAYVKSGRTRPAAGANGGRSSGAAANGGSARLPRQYPRSG
jgi:DNA-binding GntR family transcriptional regulator